jgi:hypothetical protein
MKWLLLILLAGCSQYEWTGKFPESKEYEWVVVHNKLSLHNVCAISFDKNPTLAACAFQIQESGKCYIYSIWTEDEARRVRDLDGESIYEHEKRHCKGERH